MLFHTYFAFSALTLFLPHIFCFFHMYFASNKCFYLFHNLGLFAEFFLQRRTEVLLPAFHCQNQSLPPRTQIQSEVRAFKPRFLGCWPRFNGRTMGSSDVKACRWGLAALGVMGGSEVRVSTGPLPGKWDPIWDQQGQDRIPPRSNPGHPFTHSPTHPFIHSSITHLLLGLSWEEASASVGEGGAMICL